jgi:hypothetical protein
MLRNFITVTAEIFRVQVEKRRCLMTPGWGGALGVHRSWGKRAAGLREGQKISIDSKIAACGMV